MGSHFLLQGIFPTLESHLCLFHLLHWQADSLPPCHLGSPLCNSTFLFVARLCSVGTAPFPTGMRAASCSVTYHHKQRCSCCSHSPKTFLWFLVWSVTTHLEILIMKQIMWFQNQHPYLESEFALEVYLYFLGLQYGLSRLLHLERIPFWGFWFYSAVLVPAAHLLQTQDNIFSLWASKAQPVDAQFQDTLGPVPQSPSFYQ